MAVWNLLYTIGESTYNEKDKKEREIVWFMEFVIPYKWLALYGLVVNIAAFIFFAVDKWKAKHNKWRIREVTLLSLALVGGSAGALLSMYFFRHKTKKWYFSVGVPFMLIVQIALLIYLKTINII